MKKFQRRFRLLSIAFLLFGVCVPASRAAWRAAGNVVATERRTDGVLLTLSSGAKAYVTFHDLDVVRVRLAPSGRFERDFSYAVDTSRDRKTVAAVVRETRDAVMIATHTSGPEVIIGRSPFHLTMLDGRGRSLLVDDPLRPTMIEAEGGGVETTKKREAVEMYYGFGEKALPFSRHNQSLVMWNTDTFAYPPGLDPIYQSIPFFIALKQGLAYGLFFDNTARTYFDMGKRDPARYTFGAPAGELNYYVFTGGQDRSPKKILEDYTRLTGRTPLPPLWSLGYQQSRYSYYPEAKVREIARGLRDRRIPADTIVLDIDYMDGYRVFTWDKKNFPDPPKLIADLRDMGLRTVVIIDPGIKVDENYHAYREGRAGGFFHRTAQGREFHARVWPGLCAFPDFTDPRARAWFGSLYEPHIKEGVSGFWNDMNEPGVFPPADRPPQPRLTHDPQATFPLDVRHHGDGQPGDHARYHNTYGMQMARSTFEGVSKLRPDARPFVLTRAGYAGVQRYAAVWTGDNVSSWEHLQLSIGMLLNMGVSGLPFVGGDVGGFAGNATPELYARWLQAAALTPFFRTHVAKEFQEREPWSFGEDYTKISRASIELRYRLLPYLYTLFREHEETGAPVMRPLWFEYPQDIATYLNDNQFLVGRDLLVAPVTAPGVTRRSVYFPRGDAWLDWWTGARYEGGKAVEVDAPLDRLPLFVRAGAVLPVQPVIQHTGEAPREPLTLLVVAGAGGTARIHQDEGDGYAYRRDGWRATEVTHSAGALRLKHVGYEVGRAVGAVEILGAESKPRAVRADGREVKDVSYERGERRVRFRLPGAGVSEITYAP